jgi:gliding motility-associated-like protein
LLFSDLHGKIPSEMILQIYRVFVSLWLLVIPGEIIFAQQFASKDNYTGQWDSSSSWIPEWTVPDTIIDGYDITINGYITIDGSLEFRTLPGNLIINDTLVVLGDLYLGDLSNLTVNEKGILIVRGDLTFGKNSNITANNYIVVTGELFKSGSKNTGSFTSSTNPVRVFIGSKILPVSITYNQPNMSAVNCSEPGTIIYPGSSCSYGNMEDFKNDPIYPFFVTTCSTPIPEITASGPTAFCAGDSVILTSSEAATYLWSTGEKTKSIKVILSGSYTVRTTNAAKCQSIPSAATVVTVYPIPATPTIAAGGLTAFCTGDSVTLTSSPGSTYLWSNGATTQSINVTSSGSYSVQVTNAGGCISAISVASAVTVNAPPAVPVITASGPPTFCTGGNVTLTSVTGASYLWSTGETSRSINIATAGSYSVRITDSNGCQSASSVPVTVNVNPLPEVNAGADITIPNGTSTTLNATVTGSGPFSFSWTPSSQLVNASLEDPRTVNLPVTTIFTITATSSATSCSNKDDVKVSVSGGPLSSVPEALPATVCAGTTIQLHANAGGGSGTYTYSWTSNPAGFTSSTPDPAVIPLVNTTYSVAVNDGFTIVNAQVSVSVNPIPGTPVITAEGPLIFCAGGNVNLAASAGSSYLWSNGETSQSIAATASGSYWVQVTNAVGCKSAISAAVQVTVNPIPVTPAITAGSSTTFCEGGSVLLTSSPGSAYLWSTGESSQSISAMASGSYTVRVATTSGCQSAPSVPEIVTVNALPLLPVIIADGPTTFCDGGAVTLTTDAASAYLWSDGENTPAITIATSGNFTVIVADANGCLSASSDPVRVIVNSLPSVTITSSSDPMCSNDTRTLAGSPAGGTFMVTDGPGIITGDLLSATGPGMIDLIYTYSNICSNTAVQNITINESPEAVSGPDQKLTFVFETTMNAVPSTSGTGEWSLVSGSGKLEDPHSPTTRVSELGTGDNLFLWSVRNEHCEASSETRITVNDLFVPSVITPNGDGLNDYLKIAEDVGNVELIIINRWGREEYRNKNYSNEWEGQNSRGDRLPADTYFYILIFENGTVKKGSVLIKK